MQQLNQYATAIFCRLIEKLKGHQICKLTVQGHMPLHIERFDQNIITPTGMATVYSLSNIFYFNGLSLYQPEITFLVVDKRSHPADYAAVAIYPESCLEQYLNEYYESVQVKNNQVVRLTRPFSMSNACSPING